jgi:hypothetical protein
VGDKPSGCISRLVKLGAAFFLLSVLLKFLSNRSGTLPDVPSATAPSVDERQKRIDDAAIEAKQMAAQMRARQKPIPGVTAKQVVSIATQQGFTLKTHPADQPNEWLCSKESAYGFLSLDCFGQSEYSIYSISIAAGTAGGWNTEIASDATEFLPMAVRNLKIDGLDSDQAADWVATHLGENIKQQFGPCEFDMGKGNGFGLSIRIKE